MPSLTLESLKGNPRADWVLLMKSEVYEGDFVKPFLILEYSY